MFNQGSVNSLNYFKDLPLFLFLFLLTLERQKGRGRERNMDCLPPIYTLITIEPTT